MPHEMLFFEGRGKEAVLVRVDKAGRRSELRMPVTAVLQMPKIVQEMIHKILAQRIQRPVAQPGTLPIVALPVAEVGLNVEPQTNEILLTMRDTLGNESNYALPIDVARRLAERLPVRVVEAEAGAKNQKKQ